MEVFAMKGLAIRDERACGIDVGSERLHVSVAGAPAQVFGTMTRDVELLLEHLSSQGVRSVAMEATGVYWLYLYEALEAAGMEVLVVNGRHVRNVPGRKTDMSDSQWLATLHAHGLLRSGFVPPAQVRSLRDYMRLRQDHVGVAGSQVQLMQKALERMNIKLHDVISDLSGISGMKVVRAIVQGERDPQRLLQLCDAQIRKNKADRVRESLRGIWRAEHLFALRQALKGWDFYRQQIAECDEAIAQLLAEMAGPPNDDLPDTKGKPPSANTPRIDGLRRMLLQIYGGRDATMLPGLAEHSLLKLLSEVGTDLTRWPSEKHFAAWTGLAPAAAQSGKRRAHQKRHLNQTGRFFCDMARSLGASVDKGFGGFYRRLKGRRGGLVANKAVARKLAVMFWRVMVHGVEYVEYGLRQYQDRVRLTEQRTLAKLASKLGFAIAPKINNLAGVPG
jgi:transposase